LETGGTVIMRKNFTITAFQFLFIFSLIMTPVSVKAWGNKETHPAINTHAISVFEKQLKKNNPYLKNISLNGRECFGKAWDPGDGTRSTQQDISIKRKKRLRDWIIDGGFSADEPEYPMGLRHFYDPTNKSEPWLTDAYGVGKFLTSGKLPEIDAVTWAIDKDDEGDQGNGGQDTFSIEQNYSWYDAREYFRKALASDNPENIYYGQAWRAVGEVMHMMADMTVPAHVRNDGHAYFEPLEQNTNWAVVNVCAGKPASRSIKYNTSIKSLMETLATWTNKNFFSEDTIPLAGKRTTKNNKPAYSSPIITGHKCLNSHVRYKVDGQSLILARKVHSCLLYRLWRADKPDYHVCYDPGALMSDTLYRVPSYENMPFQVVKSQQSILIPTAIRACAQVLNRFLPRFEIKAEVRQTEDQEGSSNYTIFGKVKQHFHKTCWLHEKEDLKIKNSVYLMIDGKAIKLPKRIAGGDFNKFSAEFKAQPKDMVWLRYDLGGYIIESNKVEIGKIISISPAKLNAVPGREYTFRIEIADYEKYKRKDKLSLTCQGREKIKNGVLIVKKTFHKKIGTSKKFTVQLHQYPGPKILGSASAEITMVKSAGCWTLVDCHTYETGERSFLTYTIDKKKCRIKSSFLPPSCTGGKFNFGCLNNWKAPPQRLFPKTKMQIPVNITKLMGGPACSEERLGKLISEASEEDNEEKKAAILKSICDCNTCLTNSGTHENPCGGCSKPVPFSIGLSLFTDLEFSKRAENNPWTTGSLNKSVAQLENGSLKTQALLTQVVPDGIPEDRYDKDKSNLISFHVQITNSFFYCKDCNCDNSGACPSFLIGVVYVYKWDPSGNQIKPLILGVEK